MIENEQHCAIKLRCYPNSEQQAKLPQWFGNVRFVYNYFLKYQQWRYKHHLKHLSNAQMQKLLTKLKHKKRYAFLNFGDSTSLQQALTNLDIAYQRFFKHTNHAGKPKQKHLTRHKSYKGKNINNSIRIVSKHYIRFNKLGNLRVRGNISSRHNIISATLELTPQGRYYLVLSVKKIKPEFVKTGRSIGIDVGLRNIANLSNGRKYKSLRFKQLDRKIKIAQRKLSKRTINAKNAVVNEKHTHRNDLIPFEPVAWHERKRVVEARETLARLHGKKANYRKDYLQKLSTQLVKQYDVIVMEDLKVSNMVKNHHLARAISNQGWRIFREILQYKCDWYGKTLILVNPRNTTQICAKCGYRLGSDARSTKIGLSVEQWTCPNCHSHHDRDTNAARNILKAGLTTLITEINN